MKNLENGEEIMFGRALSEIPPNPPLKKGGRGDFWPEPWSKGKSWFLVASLPIYEALLKSDRSLTFRTKSNIGMLDQKWNHPNPLFHHSIIPIFQSFSPGLL
jgi:hypothetical protein